MTYTRDWDETAPIDHTKFSQQPGHVRSFKTDLAERISAFVYGFVSGETDTAFKRIDFKAQGSDPSAPASTIISVYAKTVSSAAELYLRHTSAGVIQLTSLGKILLGAITVASAAAGDIIYYNGTSFVRLAIGTALQVLRVNAGATAPEWGEAAWAPGFISGAKISVNGSDASHDIDVAAGYLRDDSNAYNVTVPAYTKQMDATFAAGNNAGGMFSGVSLTNDTWYYVFVVRKTADGSIDIGFDTSVSGANVNSGWTIMRRIGCVRYGTAAIIPFNQVGKSSIREYYYEAAYTVLNAGTQASFTDVDCSSYVPSPSRLVYLHSYHVGGNDYRTSLRKNGSSADDSGTSAKSTLGGSSNNSTSNSHTQQLWVPTDSSRIIEYKMITGSSVTLNVIGFKDEI